jgi:type II restriction enzyme
MEKEQLVTTKQETVRGFSRQCKARARWLLYSIDLISKEIEKNELSDEILRKIYGISNKAYSHINKEDKFKELIEEIESFLKEEINEKEIKHYKKLFAIGTEGDSIGGSLRNWTGKISEFEFYSKLFNSRLFKDYEIEVEFSDEMHTLNLANFSKHMKSYIKTMEEKPYKFKESPNLKSIKMNDYKLLCNRTPKWIGKNIDMIIVKENVSSTQIEKDDCTLFGEIKGGFDPAGSDEHWKTAKSALDRIRRQQGNKEWNYIFAGRCIVDSVADEIIEMIDNGDLSFAININETDGKMWDDLLKIMFHLKESF